MNLLVILIVHSDMSVGKSSLLHQFTEKKCVSHITVGTASLIIFLQSWLTSRTQLAWSLARGSSRSVHVAVLQPHLTPASGKRTEDQAADMVQSLLHP